MPEFLMEEVKQQPELETARSTALVLAKSTNDEEKDSNDLIHTENQIDRDLDPHGNLTYTTVISVDMRILTP